MVQRKNSGGLAPPTHRLSKWSTIALYPIVILVLGFCTLVFLGVQSLNTQVDRWTYLERLDDARERLVAEVRLHLEDDSIPSAEPVLRVFEDMQDLVAQLEQDTSENSFAVQAEERLLSARRLFIQANLKRAEALQNAERVSNHLSKLSEIVNGWARQLKREKAATKQEFETVTRELQINIEKQRLLALTMLNAQSVGRQLDAARRVEAISPTLLLASVRSLLQQGSFPPACTDEDRSLGEALCTPSSSRVLRAIDGLDVTDKSRLPGRLTALSTALKAYVRSGRTEYSRLLAAHSEKDRETDQHRLALANLDELDDNVTQTLRLLGDLETGLDTAFSQSESLASSTTSVELTVYGVRARMLRFIQQRAFVDLRQPDVVAATAALFAGWREMSERLQVRDSTFHDFEKEMTLLGEEITGTVANARSQTGQWVRLFAVVSVVAAVLLGATLLVALWLARAFVLVPMSQVTSSIHRLAQGRLGGTIPLKQTAFGYKDLRDALYRLSAAMQERAALEERNVQQTATIEANLEEMQRTHQELQWLAMHDPLTKLPNRRKADADLAELTRASQGGLGKKPHDFCLIHLDIDRFKQINDTLGHEAGDFVLSHVAGTLRAYDSQAQTCYRIGGDEFLIIISQDIDAASVTGMAQDMVDKLAQPIDYAGHHCRIGGSLGIAFGRDAGGDAPATLVNADLALYEAKRCGRNCYKFYGGDLLELSRRRSSMGDRLLAAIEAEEFVPFYQPQFYADGLTLRGVETLCRWHTDAIGWIPPSEFLGIAAEMNLLAKIDKLLLKRAAKDIQHLRELGLSLPQISFNITADRLTQRDLAEDLLTAVGSETRVALELLESMSLDTLSDAVRWSIDLLKERGVAIEIDDFGSCRASVAGLIAVGPDAMKIDGSLILPMTRSDQHHELVRAIIDIGRALNIEVVGEGVETQEHIDMLRAMGCDVLQGFGLAEPMPVSALADHLPYWAQPALQQRRVSRFAKPRNGPERM